MRRFAALLLAVLLVGGGAACAQTGPVRNLAPNRLLVAAAPGGGTLPVFVDPDWIQPYTAMTRVVVMLPDAARDWAAPAQLARKARAAAGAEGQNTMIVVPQFLTPADLVTNSWPTSFLRWREEGWAHGAAAHGPALLSSFDALDAVLERVASVRILPNLRLVVLAGHGLGGQLAQRYAVAGRGPAALAARNIRVRFVAANAGAYLYVRPERPAGAGAAACPGGNAWPYGLEAPPPYVSNADKLEAMYVERDVVHLLGQMDNDANAPGLDRSCAAMRQGADRLARGLGLDAVLRGGPGRGLAHRVVQLPGIGHDAAAVFASPCGMAALFDGTGCDSLTP